MAKTAKFTICLFFSDTGGGHRSATEAVEAGLESVFAQTCKKNHPDRELKILCDNIIEKSHFINRFFVETYNFFLRHHQAYMKYYFWLVQQFQPNNSRFGYWLVKSYLHKLLLRMDPDLVVSIHPMVNHYIAHALKDLGLNRKLPFVIVVTDPNDRLWRGWACTDADLTIVPNQATKDKLLSWGIAEKKIQIVGMPVHPVFINPPLSDRQKFISHLGLSPDVFTLCINAGWAGGGNMIAIYKALSKVKKKIQVVFLCGHNYKLYTKISRIATTSSIPTRILPFHDNMSELMNAVDLMVTKAGGLTTFESIARRLPMAIDVITAPMPQEAGTIDILLQASLEAHLAHAVRKPEDIVHIVESTVRKVDRQYTDLPTFQNLDRVEAIYDIAKIVLSYLEAPTLAIARDSN